MWNYLEKALCFWGGFWQVNILTWTNGKHNKSHFQRRLRAVKARKMKWTKILERERALSEVIWWLAAIFLSGCLSVLGMPNWFSLTQVEGLYWDHRTQPKARWSHTALGARGVGDGCLVSTLYCNLPPSRRTQKMKTSWGKTLSQYTPRFFLKRCIKSWGCVRQDTDEEDENFCTSCNQLVLKGWRVTMLAMK